MEQNSIELTHGGSKDLVQNLHFLQGLLILDKISCILTLSKKAWQTSKSAFLLMVLDSAIPGNIMKSYPELTQGYQKQFYQKNMFFAYSCLSGINKFESNKIKHKMIHICYFSNTSLQNFEKNQIRKNKFLEDGKFITSCGSFLKKNSTSKLL